MRGLDDPSLASLKDPRTRLIIELLTESVYDPSRVTAVLEAAGLKPGRYPLERACLTWQAAVPDAAKQQHLSELIARVVDEIPAFGKKLEGRLQDQRSKRPWYYTDNPYAARFVGPGASHAVIDREDLRSGLHDLVEGEYRALLVSGKARSGKSHSWVLITHLRDEGCLDDQHRLVRVSMDDMVDVDEVTGEALASRLADMLGLNIALTPSGELADARARKLVDMIVGRYPQGDGVTRWIILDGLDRPGVLESARDVAKRLIKLVIDGDLPQTRLIVTGLDNVGLTVTVQVERIPVINADRVRSFLADVAEHLGRDIDPEKLDACVAEVLGKGEPPRDLYEIEQAVVQLAKGWAGGRHDE
jgi:hypothetical protein